jgi:radical SAM-linked protein
MVYRPTREREARSLLEAVEEALELTGYEDLALTSLSIGDYGPLDEVLEVVMDRYSQDRVSMSLPSMRIGGLTPSVAKQIQRVRRTGFTIAPEAGTERLRKVINKDFTDEEILQTAQWVFSHGWEAVKLYFMIGLPSETDEDLDGIIQLARTIAGEAPGKARVTVNISPFVPKAHTPFQWVAQDPEPDLKRKLDHLQKKLRGGKIQVRWGRTDQALLEGTLARGDRRIARVIEMAWRSGATMDGWEEHFDWRIWDEAFIQADLDPHWFAARERDTKEILPWDHISCGVSRDYLLSEFEKSLVAEITPDCRDAGCLACGVCTPEQINALPPLRSALAESDIQLPPRQETQEADRPLRRIRIVFNKKGDLRFLGHLEMARMFERACRRARIPLSFTGGYSPKPRITFALSLPTGTEALAEWLDLELSEAWSPEEVMRKLNGQLPPGIRVVESWKVPVDVPALNGRVRFMNYEALLPESGSDLDARIQDLMSRSSVPVVRLKKGKERTLDLKDYLFSMGSSDDRTLVFTIALKGEEGSARPQEVLQALLGSDGDVLADVRLTRTSLTFSMEQDKAGGRPGWARIWD